MADIAALKAAVSFRDLVSETHDIERSGNVLCPFHDDHNPSCHIYENGYKCFPCGASGDAVDWLEAIHNLSTAEAIRELERRAGGVVVATLTPLRSPVEVAKPAPTFKPVAPEVLERHRRQAAQLCRIPSAMEGRGFSLDDLRRLQIVPCGHDAVFPVTSPDGCALALKRRYAELYQGQRYRYMTPGHGTPAWCSPDFTKSKVVLIVEGELNGVACWFARPELAVMGVAGTGGSLHPEALEGRIVYCYGDGDDPGQRARDRWAAQALAAGAERVFVLEPWPMDACDIAGREGRSALRKLLE